MPTITLNEAARAEADAQKAERHTEGYFTLIEVIDDLALQLCLHAGGKATLREDFLKAVRMDKLTTRRRHTALEYKPETVRDYYDLVTLFDVNAWLEKQGAPYRWKHQAIPELGVADSSAQPARAHDNATPAPMVTESVLGGVDAVVPSVNTRNANKKPKTIEFEKAAMAGMTEVWNDYKHNKARDPTLKTPTKGKMHEQVMNLLTADGIKSANSSPTIGMVFGATKKWKKPALMPVSVSPSVAPQKRHAFKGVR